MKRLAIISVLLAAGILSGCVTRPAAVRVPAVRSVVVSFDQAEVVAEVADTDAARIRGLSGRASLGDDEGMLFVFPKADTYEFWMNGMLFPLDFVWLREGRVVGTHERIPPPSPAVPEPARVVPGEPVDMVLELPSGWIAEHGVAVGQQVSGLTGLGR